MNQPLNYLQARVAAGDIEQLSEADLLTLIISDPATAKEIIAHFGGYRGMADQPLEKFLRYHGLGDAKIIRIAACFELARRVVSQVLTDKEEKERQLCLKYSNG